MMVAPRGDEQRPPVFLRGIGVDAEQVSRFAKLAAGDKPWRHVYSPREAGHLAAQPQAALAFCFAFCCKEALCKALGAAYAFPEFECLYRPDALEQEILLAPGFRERQALEQVAVRFDERFLEERGECLVEVHVLHGQAQPGGSTVRSQRAGVVAAGRVGVRLETLAVAAVEADRRRIEDEHFSAAELADLGRRRVQSLAGFLAIKRALAGLWVEAGGGAAARPREFELGHHANGAPRLVAAPAGVAPEEALISIAHTRQWAYGLASRGSRNPGD